MEKIMKHKERSVPKGKEQENPIEEGSWCKTEKLLGIPRGHSFDRRW